MVREILTLSVGKCGLEFGQNVTEQYCKEHNINTDGTKTKNNMNNNNKSNDDSFHTFFEEPYCGLYSPLNIFCDFGNDTINYWHNECNLFRNSKYKYIMPSEYFICGKEDGSNIFSHFLSNELMDKVGDRIRMKYDGCDNPQGFIINHSMTGGAGSGFTSNIIERLSVDYRKKIVLGFGVFPLSINMGNNENGNIIHPYNMILCIDKLLDEYGTDISIMFDNNSLTKMCQNNLNIHDPTYNNLNEIITKCISGITSTFRFNTGCELNKDLNELRSNNVPFPRIHFLIPSISPIKPIYDPITLINGFVRKSYSNYYSIYYDVMNLLYKSYNVNFLNDNILNVTESLFDSTNFLMDCPHFNVMEDKYLSCCINYKSFNNIIQYKQANNVLSDIKKQSEKIQFVEWVNPKYECCVTEMGKMDNNNQYDTDGIIANTDLSGVMIANNVLFGDFCNKRIVKPFTLLFNKRAFFHWYYEQGIEESEFHEANENVNFLLIDYKDILTEQTDTDHDDVDDDDDDQENGHISYNSNAFIIHNEQEMVDQALKHSLMINTTNNDNDGDNNNINDSIIIDHIDDILHLI